MLYLTLRQIEYVVAVANHGSLTEAAITLNVSQPSLSVAITRVEEHLGSKLFIRRRGARLRTTLQGDNFVGDARELLKNAARLEDPLSPVANKSRPVRLGIFDDIAPSFLGPLLVELKKMLPNVEVLPTLGDFTMLAKESKSGQLDMVITYDLGLDATFVRQVLTYVQPRALFPVDNGLAASQTVSLKQLAMYGLILSDEGLSIQHVLKLFKSKGLRPRVDHRVASLEVMRSLAANGLGVGITYTAPPSNVSYDNKPIRAVPIKDRHTREPIILAWPSSTVPSVEMDLVANFLSNSSIFADAPA